MNSQAEDISNPDKNVDRPKTSSGGAGGAQITEDAKGVHLKSPVQWEGEPIRWAPLELHPFKVYRVSPTEVGVRGGEVCWLKGQSSNGTSDGLVMNKVTIPDKSAISITQAGSIWLELGWTVARHSETETAWASSDHSEARLSMYRIESADFNTLSFLTSPPTQGTNTTDVWDSGSKILSLELAEVDLVNGTAAITKQLIYDTIFLPDLVDGKLISV